MTEENVETVEGTEEENDNGANGAAEATEEEKARAALELEIREPDPRNTLMDDIENDVQGIFTDLSGVGRWKVKLYRRSPNHHTFPGYSKPITTAGHVANIEDEEQLTEEWIKDEHGGGTYEAVLYTYYIVKSGSQQGKRKFGISDRTGFKIPGDPKLSDDLIQRERDLNRLPGSAAVEVGKEEASIAREAMKEASAASKDLQKHNFELQEKLRTSESERAALAARMESFEREIGSVREAAVGAKSQGLDVARLLQDQHRESSATVREAMNSRIEGLQDQLTATRSSRETDMQLAAAPMQQFIKDMSDRHARDMTESEGRGSVLLKIMSSSNAAATAMMQTQMAMQMESAKQTALQQVEFLKSQAEMERRSQDKRERDLMERLNRLETEKSKTTLESLTEMSTLIKTVKEISGGFGAEEEPKETWEKVMEIATPLAPHLPAILNGLMTGARTLVTGQAPQQQLPQQVGPTPEEVAQAQQEAAQAEQDADVNRIIDMIVQGRTKGIEPDVLAGTILGTIGVSGARELINREVDQVVSGLATMRDELASAAAKEYVRDLHAALGRAIAGEMH